MTRTIGLLLAVTLAAAGCTENTRTTPPGDAQARGRVYLLSGAGGMMGECQRLRSGLKQAGVCRPIEIYHWSHGGVLADQTGLAVNQRKARELARKIETYLHGNPGAEVHLIGVSAGTGLVVWALEDIEPGLKATAGILISSSLDTGYDLTRALANTNDGIYSFNSMADTVLSLGVTWAGTVDRNGGLAGGLVGFSMPSDASDETKRLYKEKLHEIGWWPGDAVLGHIGDHLGATSPAYVKQKVAPIVLGDKTAAPTKPAAPPAVRAEEVDTPDPGKETPDPKPAPTEADDKPATPKTTKPAETDAVSSPIKEQAEKVRADLEKAHNGTGGTGDRFHNWRVRAPDRPSSTTARTIDESVFFSRPEHLP